MNRCRNGLAVRPLVPGVLGAPPGATPKSPQRIAILGSTGSIGRTAVKLAERYPDAFRVVALCGHRNIKLLAEQALALRPRYVATTDESCFADLRNAIGTELRCFDGQGTTVVLGGSDAARTLAALHEVDTVLAAIMGSAGLESVVAALTANKRVALANKESLVAGGALVARTILEGRGELLPVDSEHAALFQALLGIPSEQLRALVLTASGGPFLKRDPATLSGVTPAEAVRHPRWNMGAKISIDSATLVNKALELIEAHWLFGIPQERIDVIIHPQSIVHSMVELVDGTMLAQLSVSDMAGPIGAALAYPDRLPEVLPRLSLAGLGQLTFEELSPQQFPAVGLARSCLQRGGNATAVFNAANERAVLCFMNGRLPFNRIVPSIEEALAAFGAGEISTLAALVELEREVYAQVERSCAMG